MMHSNHTKNASENDHKRPNDSTKITTLNNNIENIKSCHSDEN